MTTSQKTKLAERIAFRVNECGMTFTDAVRDVMQWIGSLPDADVIEITSAAGRLVVWG